MGLQIRDRNGNVIGEQETYEEMERRQEAERWVLIIVIIGAIIAAIVKYWYISVPIILVGFLIWGAFRNKKSDIPQNNNKTNSTYKSSVKKSQSAPKQLSPEAEAFRKRRERRRMTQNIERY